MAESDSDRARNSADEGLKQSRESVIGSLQKTAARRVGFEVAPRVEELVTLPFLAKVLMRPLFFH